MVVGRNSGYSDKYAIDLATMATSALDAGKASRMLAEIGLKVAASDIQFKRVMGQMVLAIKTPRNFSAP